MGALLTYIGELKANDKTCDIDGTLNLNGLYQEALTTKFTVVKADELTTFKHFDRTDPDNVVPIRFLRSEVINVDNPRFVKTDLSTEILYSRLITNLPPNSELEKVEKFMTMLEQVFAAENEMVQSNIAGTIENIYVLKDEVTQV